jgi:hypothetical protein
MEIDFAHADRGILRIATVDFVMGVPSSVCGLAGHTVFNILRRRILQDRVVHRLASLME